MKITNSKSIPAQAYVLAGGQSKRMGQDKLFLPINGEPLLERTIRICNSVFTKTTIVAKEIEKFSNLKTPILIDHPNAPGPLGGILAALNNCPDESCFIIAADLADIDQATIVYLIQNYNNEDYLGLRETGGLQPLCGIYSKSALKEFQAVADQNKPYQLWKILENLNSKFLPLQKTTWRNINTPADTIESSKREEARK